MEFVDVVPPDFEVPLIELETVAGITVDLYNDSDLHGVVIGANGLDFEFDSGELGRVIVRFSGLRNLRVVQPPDWDAREARQIEHLLLRHHGPWPRVVFLAGGLVYEFDSDALCLLIGDGR